MRIEQSAGVVVKDILDVDTGQTGFCAGVPKGIDFFVQEECDPVGGGTFDLPHMRIYRDIAVEALWNLIYIESIFADPFRPHPQNRQIASKENALGTDSFYKPLEHPLVGVRRYVKKHSLGAPKALEGIPYIFITIGSSDVGDDELNVRVAFFDLEHLLDIHVVAQPCPSGNMQHDYPGVTVEYFELMMG